MIRHVCMFKLKEEAGGKSKTENLHTAVTMLKALYDLPGVVRAEVVTNSPLTPDSNYDLCLIFDFKNVEDLNAYQAHPRHAEFGAFITPLRESRACIDYEF